MTKLLLPCFLFAHLFSWAQRYQVFDKDLKEGVSFAKVYPDASPGLLTDIDGYFNLDNPQQKVRIRALGYHDSTFVLADQVDGLLILRSTTQETQEVTVIPGVNPALRIVASAIENRKKNHPQAHGGFIADQYSKFVFDLDENMRRKMADTLIEPKDTAAFAFKKFTDQQAYFISETQSRHFFEPPYREKESIEAFRVSGFTDPALSSIAQGLQSFHFYEIQLEILGLQYLSPLAPGSLKRYFYSLKDTTINGQDTTFTIFFKPKRGADFTGLIGYMYINTNGFAIEKVMAAPFDPPPGSNRVAITQEYQLIAGQIWFPKQLSTEIYLPFIQLSFDSVPAVIVGKGLNVVKSVQFDPPELEKVKFQNINVETLPNAATKLNEAQWDSIRMSPLTKREIETYRQIDSLSKEFKFDQKLKMAKIIATGKLPIGYAQIDFTKVLRYNAFERARLGIGLESSSKLSKGFKVGGSIGYGLNDNRSKYEVFTSVRLPFALNSQLKAFRSYDIQEIGAPVMYQSSMLFKQDAARYLYVTNMAYQDKLGFEFSTNLRANVRIELEANLQRNWFTDNYLFKGESSAQAMVSRLTFNWAPREKSAFVGDLLLPKKSPFPKLQVQYERGWPLTGWVVNSFVFNRLQLNIFQVASIPGWGLLNWNFRCAFTDRPTPLLYQNAISASKALFNDQRGISVANTFETLHSTAFYHQKQAQFFIRYIQNAWRTKAKWNEPQVGAHFAYGWGVLADKSLHQASVLSIDEGYTEAGIILNGIYVSGISSLGISLFSSFGYYASKDWKQNLVPKLSFGYVF